MNRLLPVSSLAFVSSVLLVACGGSSSSSGGGGGGGGGLNGCTTFTDMSSSNAIRVINFANFSYNPACMQIAAGQSVTFSGNFGAHPLTRGAKAGSGGVSDSANPITAPASGNSVTIPLTTPGDYPYFCATHFASNNMYGVVRVQ